MGVTPDGCPPSWICTVYDALVFNVDYVEGRIIWVVLFGLNGSLFAILPTTSVVC